MRLNIVVLSFKNDVVYPQIKECLKFYDNI